MLIFKRLESEDESFKGFFDNMSAKYILPDELNFESEEDFNNALTTITLNLAELTGVFCAVTR